jgi:hypothetical protein
MKKNIVPGSIVTLGPENGLGCNPFLVLEVVPKDVIHRLHVRGINGQTWWARIEGARVIA